MLSHDLTSRTLFQYISRYSHSHHKDNTVVKPPDLFYADPHYVDVIMTTIASQITSLTVVYSTVYRDADQRKHQSNASLAFVWGIHRDRWIPRTKGQLRGNCFHLMTSSCYTSKTACLHWHGPQGHGLIKKCTLNKRFQIWLLIGWQYSHQPIGSHVRKSLLRNTKFNID